MPEAARPVSFAATNTVAMLRVTVEAASPVCCTVLAVSAVALFCSSMVDAMTRLMLETFSMVLTMPSIAATPTPSHLRSQITTTTSER